MVSSEAGMRRREFIGIFGLLGLGGATLWRNLASFWRPSFGEHTVQTVTAVTDLMFPGEGLPGATALGIHNRIVAMSDFHPIMSGGVDWLDKWATSQGASDFLALDESARLAAVGAAFESEDDHARQFVVAIRYYGVLNYYSEPVIKAAFPYTGPPQPEGFPDFQDAPK
jgi:MYXO-CTERM domain-containing protein